MQNKIKYFNGQEEHSANKTAKSTQKTTHLRMMTPSLNRNK